MHSITLSGQPREAALATISCARSFKIDFIHVLNISISNILVKSCADSGTVNGNGFYNSALLFVNAKNIMIENVKIVNGGIIVTGSKHGSLFHLVDSKITSELLFYYDLMSHRSDGRCSMTEKVYIHNSNTSVYGHGPTSLTVYCIEFDIQNVIFEHDTSHGLLYSI